MSFVDKFALRKRSEIDDYQSYNLGFSSLCVGTENKFCFKSEYLVPSRKVVIEEENQISEVYRGGKISFQGVSFEKALRNQNFGTATCGVKRCGR